MKFSPRSGLRDVLQVTLTGVEAGVEVALLACVHTPPCGDSRHSAGQRPAPQRGQLWGCR